MNNTTVIYHRADFDGLFCREIARKFLPGAELIGWDFKDEPLAIPIAGTIYILDLPVDRVFGFNFLKPDSMPSVFGSFHATDDFLKKVIWIDHHASSIQSHPKYLAGYRLDGVAACRLAWQWFIHEDANAHLEREIGHRLTSLPGKSDFMERSVSEPLAVRLAGEYDIWDKRDPRAELFQHGLKSCDLTHQWGVMLLPNRKASVQEVEELIDVGHQGMLNPDGTMDNPTVLGLLEGGKVLQYASERQNESIIKDIGFTFEWEGLTWLGCNHARFNSFLFTAGLKPEHQGLFGFKWTGKDWAVSLYHAPGHEDRDLSEIAAKFGGGGHRGACGFRTVKLPFLPA